MPIQRTSREQRVVDDSISRRKSFRDAAKRKAHVDLRKDAPVIDAKTGPADGAVKRHFCVVIMVSGYVFAIQHCAATRARV